LTINGEESPGTGDETRLTDGLKWLAGIFVVSGAALALAGATQGEMTRIARYYPYYFLPALLLLLAAVVVSVRAAYFETRRRWRVHSASLGLVLFFLGTLLLLYGHTEATKAQERPTVVATVTETVEGLVAHIEAKASGLGRNQYLYILLQGQNSRYVLDAELSGYVQPVATVPPPTDGRTKFSKQRISQSRVGPTPDGQVDVSFDVAVAEGLYEQIAVQATIADEGDAGLRREQSIQNIQAWFASVVASEQPRLIETDACSDLERFVSCTTVLLPLAPTDPSRS
jgi:hypothetical protein